MELLLVGMCIIIIRIFTVDKINRLKHVLECHYRVDGRSKMYLESNTFLGLHHLYYIT